jgi:dTDP-glucose 4,6-dehydratase
MSEGIKNILVTGGLGFIGSNFLNEFVPKFRGVNFINLDKMTYAANPDNVSVDSQMNYFFEKGDVCDLNFVDSVFGKYAIDAVVHFAAETHVDFSITNPALFVQVNVLGTQNLLQTALKYQVKRFHHVSTDEVYGELDLEGFFTENTHLAPNSPYSASKAGSDLLVRAYQETFGLNTTITRCSNNYGPNQDSSKLIPKFITLLNQNQSVPLYKDGKNVRDWLFVTDHVEAIWEVFSRAKPGSVYNIGGNNEKSNLEITQTLLQKLGKSEDLITFVQDRKGHDFRYAIDASKIKNELGWAPRFNFEDGISQTIEFYTKI